MLVLAVAERDGDAEAAREQKESSEAKQVLEPASAQLRVDQDFLWPA
jgi:hypothetical protein